MCSIKSKCLSQKYALAPAQKPIVQRCQHKQVVFPRMAKDHTFPPFSFLEPFPK